MRHSRRETGDTQTPVSVDEILAAAVRHHKAGNLSQAEAHYRQVLQQAPENAPALHYLGLIARQLGKLDIAARFLQQALNTSQNDATLHYNFALTLQQLARREEAIHHYHKAIELQPDFAQAYNNLGVVLQDLGEYDEANKAFVDAMGQNPGLAEAYYNLAQSKKYVTEPIETDQIQQLLAAPGVTTEDKVRLHFTLGKIYDDIGRYADAFEHFKTGNEAKDVSYDGEAFSDFVSRTIETFDSDFFANRRMFGDPATSPVFVIGMPRSGTTLVEQIISSHPDVYGAGELEYVEKIASSLQMLTGSAETYPLCAAHLDSEATRFLARDYSNRIQSAANGAKHFTDKTPINFLYLGLIALIFPNARIVHCRRHPLDVGLSCYFQNFSKAQSFAYDLSNIGNFYLQYERLMRHWQKTLDLDILEVRYEDLINDQEAATQRLLSFCGLSWDNKCLAFHENDRVINTASKWQVRQPLYGAAVDRWVHYNEFLAPLKVALNWDDDSRR